MGVSGPCDEDGFFSLKNLASVVQLLFHSLLAEGLNVKTAVTVGHPGLKG